MSQFLFRTLTYLEMGQLHSLYNDAQLLLGRGSEDFLTRAWSRRDRAEAEIARVRQKLEDMHGFAELELLDVGRQIRWLIMRPRAEVPASSESVSRGGPRESTTTLELSSVLVMVSTVNPKRAGTRAWETFEIYHTLPGSATGEDFVGAMVEEGYSRRLALSTLHWDIQHGFVRLGEPPEVATPADGPATPLKSVETPEVSEDTSA